MARCWQPVVGSAVWNGKSILGQIAVPNVAKKLVNSFEREKDFYRSECAYGSFQRSVHLPHRVKAQGAKTKYGNGILEIRIPKTKGEGAKSLPVRQADAEIKVD